MSWTSILTALALAALSAYFVILKDWVLWKAFALVGGGMLVLVLTLIAVVLSRCPPNERKEFWGGFRRAVRDALRFK